MKKKNGRKVKKLRWNRSFVVLASVLVLAIGLVGTTLAFITAQTNPVENIFTPTGIPTEITEKLEAGVKNDVRVKNTGNIDAYIRAMVVVTWQDDEGHVYPAAPVAGTDYMITIPGNAKWVKSGNYYYYTEAVKAGQSTEVLLTGCKPVVENTPDGYHLVVEILSDAIQALPAGAVTDAWGVEVNEDGTLKVNAYAGGISE